MIGVGTTECGHGVDELAGIYRLRQVHLKTRGLRGIGILMPRVRGQRDGRCLDSGAAQRPYQEYPSSSGIRISEIRTSGASVSMPRLASFAVAATSTEAPALSSVLRTTSRVS